MGAMEDAFGFMPARPDTEEFWRLSSLALELDGRMEAGTKEEKDRAFTETVSSHVGMDEITYLAMQRAFRFLGVKTQADLMPKIVECMQLTAFWMEAFVFGAEWEQRKS